MRQALTADYVFCLGGYRFLYIFNWYAAVPVVQRRQCTQCQRNQKHGATPPPRLIACLLTVGCVVWVRIWRAAHTPGYQDWIVWVSGFIQVRASA